VGSDNHPLSAASHAGESLDCVLLRSDLTEAQDSQLPAEDATVACTPTGTDQSECQPVNAPQVFYSLRAPALAVACSASPALAELLLPPAPDYRRTQAEAPEPSLAAVLPEPHFPAYQPTEPAEPPAQEQPPPETTRSRAPARQEASGSLMHRTRLKSSELPGLRWPRLSQANRANQSSPFDALTKRSW
jgi:hypothetical protein